MEIIEPIYKGKEEFVATIGFFDGVHKGHQYVIEQLKQISKEKNQKNLIITFDIHPRKVLQSDYQPKLLTTLSEKLFRLDVADVDACAVLNFTLEMARLSAFDFMKDVLKERYNVSTLLIGYDHRFGHNRQESFSDYMEYGKKLGIDIIQLNQYGASLNSHVSSSEIRRALLNGNIQKAKEMLGYAYSLDGKVIGGFKIGRKIGFPTANLHVFSEEKIIPKTGVYVVHVLVNDILYYGMLNIGNRPTLQNGNNVSIEVHIIGFDKDIYNHIIQIRFLEKIRDEEKFTNIEELVLRLNEDRQYVIKNYCSK